MVSLIAVILAAFVASAFFFSAGSPTASKTTPPGFVRYTNKADGFSLSYPKQWRMVTDPNVPLILSAGGNDALSVRVLTLQNPVNTGNEASIKAVTDAILSTPTAGLQVLGATPITIGGIHGYYYLYTFPSGNTRGVHAHYFLFQGRKLTMLVFQALPVSDFQTLAPMFDKVSASFRSNPNILGPTPSPATTAPATTAPATTAPATTAPATTAPATTSGG